MNHPDFFKGETPLVIRHKPGPKRSGWRKFRDVFGYHYRTDKAVCCKTCRHAKWNWIKNRWECRLQGMHRTGVFWVCSLWKKILSKGKPK